MNFIDIEYITFQKIKVDNTIYYRNMTTNELYLKNQYELIQVYGNRNFFENLEQWLELNEEIQNKVSDN